MVNAAFIPDNFDHVLAVKIIYTYIYIYIHMYYSCVTRGCIDFMNNPILPLQ